MYHREVVDQPRAVPDIDFYRERYTDFEEAFRLISTELNINTFAHEPLKFAPDYRLYTSEPIGDAPGFYVLYTLDENKVYIESMHPVSE